MKKQIGAAIGLTVFICAIFWLYTQWDLKKFRESLPKAPPGQSTPAQQEGFPQEVTETSVPAPPVFDAILEPSAPPEAKHTFDSSAVEESPTDDRALESFFDTFLEETEADAITSGDFTDVSQEAPYDVALVEKGFDDYNAYLDSDPEYAYHRLDAALREQYNDDPNVGIIVETVRRSNEGAITVDDAISHAEAMKKLVSGDGISPPEAVAVIADNLEYLREVKQLALESGEDTVHLFNFQFHFGE